MDARIAAGELHDDPAQAEAIEALDGLLDQLRAPPLANKKSSLGWLFGTSKPVAEDRSGGLYLWGGVGRGKSMLMDTFFDLAPEKGKNRIHFHAFMRDVHAAIHDWRQDNAKAVRKGADPIMPLAEDMARRWSLLCFDEFAVTDVADAMILSRLFTALMQHGMVVVATSNVEPDRLYANGLNRSWFVPFIDLVKERMQVIHLASETDHRMAHLSSGERYFTGSDGRSAIETLWQRMAQGVAESAADVEVAGRVLHFPQTAGGMVWATFASLCETPLGASDYLALAERFHTLFLVDVPQMQLSDRNAAKRFIALIDTWYDQGRILCIHAAVPPAELYTATSGTEAFEFARTVSRLQEMQSASWQGAH